jgi:hypothetical protein
VKLINTDGMAFIGPGSEWFWTALSGLVLAVTFLAIYRQLRLQSSASAIEQLGSYDREWMSERNTRYKLEVELALRDGADPADAANGAAHAISGFWENIASLARAGHIDPKLLWNSSGGDCVDYWAMLAPFARKQRTGLAMPTLYENFEWLAGVMAELDRRAGAPIIDAAYIASTLERRIARKLDEIRVEQALRTVIVAAPDALTLGKPLAAPEPAPGSRWGHRPPKSHQRGPRQA